MTPFTAYARTPDSREWHLLGGVADVDAHVPALCGAAGPWSTVTTLAPTELPTCQECRDRAEPGGRRARKATHPRLPVAKP